MFKPQEIHGHRMPDTQDAGSICQDAGTYMIDRSVTCFCVRILNSFIFEQLRLQLRFKGWQ